MKVLSNGRNIEISVRKAGFFGKAVGLMFKTSSTNNLLFEFYEDCRLAIHSYFVFFPFLILWLDEKNKVVESKVVYPFTISVYPKKLFRKIVEIPFNCKNKKIIEMFSKS